MRYGDAGYDTSFGKQAATKSAGCLSVIAVVVALATLLAVML